MYLYSPRKRTRSHLSLKLKEVGFFGAAFHALLPIMRHVSLRWSPWYLSSFGLLTKKSSILTQPDGLNPAPPKQRRYYGGNGFAPCFHRCELGAIFLKLRGESCPTDSGCRRVSCMGMREKRPTL